MSRIYWKDAREFARVVSPHKIRNYYRLRRSFQHSRRSGVVAHEGMPMAISVEPTTHCNLRCPECPSGLRSFSRPTGMLEPDTYHALIDELSPHLLYLTMYFQGEPYLHPQCSAMIRYASDKRIYTITSTNAHYLSEESCESIIRSGLSRLILSVDGATQDSYEAYRVGGDLQKVKDGVERLVRAKKRLASNTPHLVLQTIAFESNESELAQIQELANSLGVDEWVVKTAQVYDEETGKLRLPTQQHLSRYDLESEKLQTLQAEEDSCWRMWHSSVMTWDGMVVPCCFDKDASYRLGQFPQESFGQIWHSIRYKKMREAVTKARGSIDICANCSEGCRVWLKPSEVF